MRQTHNNQLKPFTTLTPTKHILRQATADDISHLVYFRLKAQDGINEALFENLAFSVEELVEKELRDLESYEAYENFWVTGLGNTVSGGIQIFPWDLLEAQSYNPIIPKERLYIEEPFEELNAPGTYYIHALGVYPNFMRQGIATRLVQHAKDMANKEGFDALSLYCVEDNTGAVQLYEKHGFKTVDKRPMPKHPKIKYGGSILLMVSSI